MNTYSLTKNLGCKILENIVCLGEGRKVWQESLMNMPLKDWISASRKGVITIFQVDPLSLKVK